MSKNLQSRRILLFFFFLQILVTKLQDPRLLVCCCLIEMLNCYHLTLHTTIANATGWAGLPDLSRIKRHAAVLSYVFPRKKK